MQLLHGSAHAIDLPAGGVQCVVTSPPYWGLRAYSGEQDVCWPAVSYAPMPGLPELSIPAQTCGLGLEPDINAYIGHMVLCLREWRRVLRDDGCAFINLGDSYTSGGRATRDPGQSELHPAQPKGTPRADTPAGLKPKDLCGIPWRFAFAAQADGWWLRSDIIWAKKNPMPESCTDRPTRSHEYVFLLAKSQRYYYDADAVKEVSNSFGRQHTSGTQPPKVRALVENGTHGKGGDLSINYERQERNLRSVWTIATQPTPFAHFATFPERIPELCIRAGTSQRGCCPECGAPWVRVVERISNREEAMKWETPKHDDDGYIGARQRTAFSNTNGQTYKHSVETLGWRPGCDHDAEPVPCVVLDPFHGSGTTGKVALRLGRAYCGVDISTEYLTTVTDARFADGVQIEMSL